MDFEDFFHSHHDLVCFIDCQGMVISNNSRWQQALGWSTGNLQKKTLSDLIHPDDLSVFVPAFESILENGKTSSCPARIKSPDGEYHWRRWFFITKAGDIISVTGTNIENHVRVNQQLKESNRLLQLATEIADIGYWRLEMTTNHLEWSPQIYRMFGVEPQDFNPTMDSAIALLDQRDRDKVRDGLEYAVKHREGTGYKYRIYRPDGECRHLQSRINCIFDGNNVAVELIGVVQDITEHELAIIKTREANAKLNYQATHDALTGLKNRRVLESELRSANEGLKENIRFAVCLIDLDQFKVVNDTCGHAAGDALLRRVANVLRDTVRIDDLVVRLGGDEFAILLYNCEAEQAAAIAENIRANIEALLFEWDSNPFRIGASIGVIAATKYQTDTSEIMRSVDAACFAAKDAGRNHVYLAQNTNQEIDNKRSEMHWVQKIHRAIDRDDFVLFCQPVVPLGDPEELQRLEVLIRLRNRKKGTLVPPGAFLSAAERYDLTTKLDAWVIRTVIKMLKTYSFLFDDKRCYWVNLSGRSIGDPRFLSLLEETMEAAEIQPGVLNFEITETAVIRNIEEAAKVITRLKRFGCRFALDDFGSGLSSFGYLKTLPVDLIKIDGMFIKDIAHDEVDRIFVKSIIDIAKVMGIKSVAEYVENEEILKIVRDLGADYGQGFALGRPAELLPQRVDASKKTVVS